MDPDPDLLEMKIRELKQPIAHVFKEAITDYGAGMATPLINTVPSKYVVPLDPGSGSSSYITTDDWITSTSIGPSAAISTIVLRILKGIFQPVRR